MATGTFTHNSLRTKILKLLIKTHRKGLETSNLTYTMLLVQGKFHKNMAFCVFLLAVRFARNCGKMYSRHLFLYGGLEKCAAIPVKALLATQQHLTTWPLEGDMGGGGGGNSK